MKWLGERVGDVSVCAVSYTHLDVYKRQVAESSKSVVFGEDRLRERGSLPTTFYVLTRVFFL